MWLKMARIIFTLLGICSVVAAYSDEGKTDSPIIITHLGRMKGSMMKTVLGKPIYAFRGIRYAKPPIKELRFQPPVPVEAWSDTYDATKDGATCPQPDLPGSDEDCLFLNVYSTKLPEKSANHKFPVLVYIHAGGFYSVGGTSVWAGPEYLLDQNIVLVTLNYRLGSLGFISTGDRHAPGNNGLKDQVVALKWIKNNIATFGGDPNLVTISGYSAGGSSVSLHMVSPMSKGLFHRAIIMSGSSYGHWPIPNEQFSLAQKQARLVGCPDDTSVNIIKCLKTKSAKELGDSLDSFAEFGNDPILIWYPVVERDFGQERFLTEHPVRSVQCMRFEQVPVITSVTKDEFGYRAEAILQNPKLYEEINNNFEKVAPIGLIYERNTDNSRYISRNLREFYFGSKPINNETKSGLQKIYADVVGFPIYRTAKLLSSRSNKETFYYLFNYRGRYSHNDYPSYGAVHHDDLIYLFYISAIFPKFNTTDPEYKIVTKLTTMFANFAKYGNPTPTTSSVLDNVVWKPYTHNDHAYLDVEEQLSMKDKLFEDRYKEWDKLFPYTECPKQ